MDNFIRSLNYEKRKLFLFVTSSVHFSNDMFVCLYPYLFSPIYDVYFAVFGIMTVVSWLFMKNECILSYIEKKLVNIDYEIGSEPFNNPYHKIFYYYNDTNYSFIKEAFWLIAFLLIIFYRKNNNCLGTIL